MRIGVLVATNALADIDHAPRARQGTLPNDELERLIAAMDGPGGWREALARLDLPVLSGKRFWFTDANKSAFYKTLNDGRHGAALDVGSGSGVIAEGLADAFDRVVALERDAQWCHFIERRLAQDGRGNVEVLCGDALTAPIGRDRFDLVVVNGVLEWVAEGNPDGSPWEVQRRFLVRLHESLRPNGAIGIAIENRFCLSHFFGVTPHGEPPWTVILPRRVADRISRRRRGLPYRTWIYGPWGYLRLLRRCGFRDIRLLQALPSYHRPDAVVSLWDGLSTRVCFPTNAAANRLVLELLGRTRLLGLLTHSFYISGRK
jgi:SAM-dependent methyltransferase